MLTNNFNPLWVKVVLPLSRTSASIRNCLLCSSGNYRADVEIWYFGANFPFCEGWTSVALLRSMEARL